MGERTRYMRVWRHLLPVWALYIPFLIWYLTIPIMPQLPPIAPHHMYRLAVLGMLLLFSASTLWNANAVVNVLKNGRSLVRYGLGAVAHTTALFFMLIFWAQLAIQVFPEVARDQVWQLLQYVVQIWLFGGIIFFFMSVNRKTQILGKIKANLQRATRQNFAHSTLISLFVRFSSSMLIVTFTIFRPFWLEGLVVLLLADFVKELYKV